MENNNNLLGKKSLKNIVTELPKFLGITALALTISACRGDLKDPKRPGERSEIQNNAELIRNGTDYASTSTGTDSGLTISESGELNL